MKIDDIGSEELVYEVKRLRSQLTECKAQIEKVHDYILMAKQMYKNKRFDLFESYIGTALETAQPKGEKQ